MTASSLNVLWLGAPWTSRSVQKNAAVSNAAHWWNSNLVESLRSLGHTVHTLAHVPQRAWPARNAELHGLFDGSIATTGLRYWNVPAIRRQSLRASYLEGAAQVRLVDAIVTYNPYPYLNRAAMRLREALQTPWICLFADLQPEPNGTPLALEQADARAFLSWHDFTEWGRSDDLHLDGGITVRDSRDSTRPTPRRVLYAGALNRYGGVHTLLESLQYLPSDVRVAIAGRGATSRLEEVRDERLERLGFLTDEQLDREHVAASAFVNPRPADRASDSNFPSKLLRYLAYQRPVVSTRTAGISPEFNEVLLYVEPDDPRGLANGLVRALTLSEDPEYARRLREFCLRRSWPVQAQRLASMLEAIITLRG